MIQKIKRWVPIALIGAITAAVVLVGALQSSAQADGYSPNCGTTAVVKCGAYEQSELDARILPDAKALYSQLGISTNLSLSRSGIVYPDGTVKVGDRVVATGAMTFGRADRTGHDQTVSAGGTTFYKHTIREAAIARAVEAHVFLDANGKFIGAIIKMCGNPVVAKPTPVPTAACSSLDAEPVTRTKVRLTAKATVRDGATISGYSFEVKRNGSVVDTLKLSSSSTEVSKDYEATNAGNYSVRVTVQTSVGSKTSDGCVAEFTVKEAPAAECVALKATVTDRVKFQLDAEASVENEASIEGYRFVVTDKATSGIVVEKTVETDAENASISGTLTPGEYSAQVFVDTTEGEKTGDGCKADFSIEKEDEMKVCELSSKTIITIPRSEYDETKHSTNLDDCSVTVCDLTTKQIITIPANEFDETKHSTNTADCQTPPELPRTGIGETFMQILGLGSMAASGGYYFVSRRATRSSEADIE